jgi:hypothetical protein
MGFGSTRDIFAHSGATNVECRECRQKRDVYKVSIPRTIAAPRPAPTESLEAAPVKGGGLSGVEEAAPLGLNVTLTLAPPVALIVGLTMVLLLPVGYGVTLTTLELSTLLLFATYTLEDEGVGVGVGVASTAAG